ncbi:MAG: nucleotidyltransferase domain-containing protein [Rickettsiales bacterium]
MLSDEEDTLIDFLEEKFGCHTIILFGSRAKGTHGPDSDWDVLAISRGGHQNWYHGKLDGVGEVSAYIYPESHVPYDPQNPSPLYDMYFARLRHGRVLVEENGAGQAIIARAKTMYQQGVAKPPPYLEDRFRYVAFVHGIKGMLSEKKTPEEKFLLRCETLPFSITLYFKMRKMWRMSYGDTFAYMQKADAKGYALLMRALQPDASVDIVAQWLEHAMTPPAEEYIVQL